MWKRKYSYETVKAEGQMGDTNREQARCQDRKNDRHLEEWKSFPDGGVVLR